MKARFLGALMLPTLAAVPFSDAHAQGRSWEYAGTAVDGTSALFVDWGTLSGGGRTAQIWARLDVGGPPRRGQVYRIEIDCSARTWTELAGWIEQGDRDEFLRYFAPGELNRNQQIPPGSGADQIARRVC